MNVYNKGRMSLQSERQEIFKALHEYYFPKFRKLRRMYFNTNTQGFMMEYWDTIINTWMKNRCEFFKKYKLRILLIQPSDSPF